MNLRRSYRKLLAMVVVVIMLASSTPPLFSQVAHAAVTTISTIAGNGTSGYGGDSGAATSAKLNNPHGVAVDSSGNVYIADSNNNRIRKIDTNGKISTIAGDGNWGSGGDGGAATSAQLNNPSGVAVDSSGNVYIADTNNSKIRKVGTDGRICTIAGIESWGYTGDGGPATSAQLSYPRSVVVDSHGNVFIAEASNSVIRKIDTNGIISTVAGTGTSGYGGDGGAATEAKLDYPYGVAVDGSGNVYIAEGNNRRIRKVDTNGFINTIAGTGVAGYSGDGGPAASAQVNSPVGIAADYAGNVYITDIGTSTIRRIYTDGTIRTIAGTGTYVYGGDNWNEGAATSVQLKRPYGVAIDNNGYLYIADTENHKIRKMKEPVLSGAELSGLSLSRGMLSPVFDLEKWAYSASVAEIVDRITITPTTWDSRATVTVNGEPLIDGQANINLSLGGNLITIVVTAIDGITTRTYTVDVYRESLETIITTIAGTGDFQPDGDGGPAVNARIGPPSGVAVDSSGNIFITDTNDNKIRKIDTNGMISTIAGSGSTWSGGDGGAATRAAIYGPGGVAVDSSGNVYIAETSGHKIRKIDTNGIISTIAGTGGYGFYGEGIAATNAQLNYPSGVAVDSSGNVFIADYYNHRIRKVDTNGIIRTVAGTGTRGADGDGLAATSAQLNNPHGVAVDSSGNLYIADDMNHKIRKVDTNGIISTVAGTGTAGTDEAYLNRPFGVATDNSGNVFFTDSSNHRIRKIDTNGRISIIAGTGTFGSEGDGGAAINAQLHNPEGVAVDSMGNVYIADFSNSKIRKLAPRMVSNDASLSGLALSSGALSPDFAAATLSYSAKVPGSMTSITLTPTVNENHATVKVNGTPMSGLQATVNLNIGHNIITVLVTAEDGHTIRTYSIDVNRELMKGDATGDGKISASDGALITKHITGKITLTPEQFAALDINEDGKVDSQDAILLSAMYTEGKPK